MAHDFQGYRDFVENITLSFLIPILELVLSNVYHGGVSVSLILPGMYQDSDCVYSGAAGSQRDLPFLNKFIFLP